MKAQLRLAPSIGLVGRRFQIGRKERPIPRFCRGQVLHKGTQIFRVAVPQVALLSQRGNEHDSSAPTPTDAVASQQLSPRRSIMKPRLFIGCSSESLSIAEKIQEFLLHDIEARIWDQGTFALGETFLESLRREVLLSEYALLIVSPDDQITKRGRSGYAPPPSPACWRRTECGCR